MKDHNLNYEWRGMEPVSWNNDLDGWQIVEEQKTLHDWSKAPDWAEYAYRDATSAESIWCRATWQLQLAHKPMWMKDVEKRPKEYKCVRAKADDALSAQEGGEFAKKLEVVLSYVQSMLLEKNRKYGDSALNPVRVFSNADALEQINVRIDDKLSRIAKGESDDTEDTELDLLGYLIIKRIAKL